MKRQPLIFLPILIDSCSGAGNQQLPTAADKECFEKITTKIFLAKTAFRFSTVDSFKTQADWNTAIQAEDIVPLYNLYEPADANTEATKYETGNFSYVTSKEVKKMTSESYLSIYSHRAMKSYESSGYTQVFEATEDAQVMGVFDSDGVKVKGQDITEFDVSIRARATKDKPPTTTTTITFRDFDEFEDNGIVVSPTWDVNTLMGVFLIELEIQGTPTATEIQFKAFRGASRESYNDLVLADLAYDSATSLDSVSVPDSAGIYTAVLTGATSGNLSTANVVDKSGVFVKALNTPVTI